MINETWFQEILESFINGNITWAKNEVSSLTSDDHEAFHLFLLDNLESGFISKRDIVLLIG